TVALTTISLTSLGGNAYAIGGLDALDGLDGHYVLTLNTMLVSDLAGNSGTGSASASWVMLTTPPTAPSGLGITPDTGASNTDGLTTAQAFAFFGTLGQPALTVHLTDITTNTALPDATVTGTSFSAPLNFATPGAHQLSATAVDAAGNSS